jgi:hypothetical protein
MTTLAVIAYPDLNTAKKAVIALHSLQDESLIKLEDLAWVTKSQDGAMKLHQGTSLTGIEAASGALWGASSACSSLLPCWAWLWERGPAHSLASSGTTGWTTRGSKRWMAPSRRAGRRCS